MLGGYPFGQHWPPKPTFLCIVAESYGMYAAGGDGTDSRRDFCCLLFAGIWFLHVLGNANLEGNILLIDLHCGN